MGKCDKYSGAVKSNCLAKEKESAMDTLSSAVNFIPGGIWFKLGAYVLIAILAVILATSLFKALFPLLPYLIVLAVVGFIFYLIFLVIMKEPPKQEEQAKPVKKKPEVVYG